MNFLGKSKNIYHIIQDGAPKIAKFPYKWFNYRFW
jgi:hypothetical protein